MASTVGFLLAFILTWMSLDSAMALPIPASVKLGTWSASYVTCQELAFYSIFVAGKQAYPCAFLHIPTHLSYISGILAGCLFSVVGPYVLQIVRGPRASALVATLDHGKNSVIYPPSPLSRSRSTDLRRGAFHR
jgi:hypothetical protein